MRHVAPSILAGALALAGGYCRPVTSHAAGAQPAPAPPPRSEVVLLGTGTPPADPDRSGPATAVVVNGTPYLVDMGAGVVRRAKSAVVDKGVAALDPVKLRVVFLTHLHSDHTVGYPACNGCDVLMHEVLTLEWLAKRPDFQGYAARFHTTTAQLTELATKAGHGS